MQELVIIYGGISQGRQARRYSREAHAQMSRYGMEGSDSQEKKIKLIFSAEEYLE